MASFPGSHPRIRKQKRKQRYFPGFQGTDAIFLHVLLRYGQSEEPLLLLRDVSTVLHKNEGYV